MRQCFQGFIFTALCFVCGFELVYSLQTYQYAFSRMAERMPKARQNSRPGLENDIAIHLYDGDILYIKLCLKRWTNITFSNLTYSNDGASERISLYFDSNYLGQFMTHSKSDWGNLWDKFYGSGYLGRLERVSPDQHVISVHVQGSKDCYGVELGSLSIFTDKMLNDTSMWCGYRHVIADTKCKPKHEVNLNMESSDWKQQTQSPRRAPPRYIDVQQLSYSTDCVDDQNIRVMFTSTDLSGTTITVRQAVSRRREVDVMDTRTQSRGRQCKSSLWQLGIVNRDNAEFENIYPGRTFTLNMSSVADPTKRFPAKILPFMTKEIVLHFEMPPDLNMKQGSAFFVLGLVNLTKESKIGLQIYDSSLQEFSEIVYLTFTPAWKVMGWHLPGLSSVPGNNTNTIKLHFISDANVILFDFIKLDFSLREERKQNILIADSGNMRLRGLRYANSVGITVSVDGREIVYNIEDVIVFLRKTSGYEVVLRIHFSGVIYPYKTFVQRRSSSTRQQMVDVSGFILKKGRHVTRGERDVIYNNITSVYVDTPTELITINYVDGSTARFKLISDGDATQLTIISYQSNGNQFGDPNVPDVQNLYFISTHVSDVVGAVNAVSTDTMKRHITLSDVGIFGGDFNFTFTQSPTSSLFYANNVFNIRFPR